MRRLFHLFACGILIPSGIALATPSYTAVFLPTGGAANTYAEGIASNGQIVGYSTSPANALIWQSYLAPATLSDTGYLSAEALATDGTVSVGYAPTSIGPDAVIWDAAGNITDLNPPGYFLSTILGVGGGQEVGGGRTSTTPNHALLWTGNDPNATDINPSDFQTSEAHGTNGTQQVGFGTTTINGQPSGYQALLWDGTAASAQNIIPAGYSDAQAWDISGNLVAGSGSPGTARQDALLWNVIGGTYSDLEPTNLSGIGETAALAVAGQYEAGYGYFGAASHALVWSGTADSAIDLQDYLPSTYAYSYALGVDAEGDVVGYAGAYGQNQAVVWLVPEPTSISSLIVLIVAFVRRGHSVN